MAIKVYWAIVRNSDGLELAVGQRRKDIADLIDSDGQPTSLILAGFLPKGENASVVKVSYRDRCDMDCDGVNEDYAVYYGICDICGLPTR